MNDLLGLNCGLTHVDLGRFNSGVEVAIPAAQMVLVVVFFMHGRYEKPFTWIFICAGPIWLLIMVDLTLSDYMSRGSASNIRQSWRHPEKNPPTIQPGGGTEPQNPATQK